MQMNFELDVSLSDLLNHSELSVDITDASNNLHGSLKIHFIAETSSQDPMEILIAHCQKLRSLTVPPLNGVCLRCKMDQSFIICPNLRTASVDNNFVPTAASSHSPINLSIKESEPQSSAPLAIRAREEPINREVELSCETNSFPHRSPEYHMSKKDIQRIKRVKLKENGPLPSPTDADIQDPEPILETISLSTSISNSTPDAKRQKLKHNGVIKDLDPLEAKPSISSLTMSDQNTQKARKSKKSNAIPLN